MDCLKVVRVAGLDAIRLALGRCLGQCSHLNMESAALGGAATGRGSGSAVPLVTGVVGHLWVACDSQR